MASSINGYSNTNEGAKLARITVVKYKQCLHNHAAKAMGFVLDGCGEFAPSSRDAMLCAACGCHRNFHKRVEEELVTRVVSSTINDSSTFVLPVATPAVALPLNHQMAGAAQRRASRPAMTQPTRAREEGGVQGEGSGQRDGGVGLAMEERGSSSRAAAAAAPPTYNFTEEQKEMLKEFVRYHYS